MKPLLRTATWLFITLSAASICGKPVDPLWLFSESATDPVFSNFRYCDTARTGDYLCVEYPDFFPDTGDSYNGSSYLNFNYKFSSDSLIVRDEFDPTIIRYKDSPRPGYAGFKAVWDMGMTGFPVSWYKNIIFAHKGPNMNHRVTVNMLYNDGSCGSPSFKETIGTFSGSTAWKLDTLVIPDYIQNKPDKEKNPLIYYEMVFIINNIDPNNKTPGQAGSLKIDDIRLAGYTLSTSAAEPKAKQNNRPDAFSIKAGQQGTVVITSSVIKNTPVTISLLGIDGRTIIDKTTRTFGAGSGACILGNANLGNGVYVVKIKGADINLSKQVVVSR